MFTTSGIQRLYDVSPQTVRNWTNEFAQHLSMSATPKTGQRRQYTLEDLTVFTLVKEMTDKGFTYEEIAVSLGNGDRGDIPEGAKKGDDEDPLNNASPEEVARTLALIRERDTALGRIEELLKENTKKDEQLVDLNKQISELNREIGRLEVRLEMEQEKNKEADD